MKAINFKHYVASLAFTGLFSGMVAASPITEFEFLTAGGFFTGSINGEGAYGTGTFGTCGALGANNSIINGNAAATCNLTLSQYDPNTPAYALNVAWGTPLNSSGARSNLQINHNPFGSTILTDGTWITIDEFVHTNNILNAAGGWMDSIGILGSFSLLNGPYSLALPYPLLFTETLNTVAPTPCALLPVGSNIATPNCPDFYLTLPLVGSDSFIIGDYVYNISFQFLAGPGAFVDQVELNGQTWQRIWTQENNPGSSIIYTQARITVAQRPTEVPTPATLILFGTALLGVRLFQRRFSN